MATARTSTSVPVEDDDLENVIAGVDAGHRMAGHEPTDQMREQGRRILRGEISADDAVQEAIARHAGASAVRR